MIVPSIGYFVIKKKRKKRKCIIGETGTEPATIAYQIVSNYTTGSLDHTDGIRGHTTGSLDHTDVISDYVFILLDLLLYG